MDKIVHVTYPLARTWEEIAASSTENNAVHDQISVPDHATSEDLSCPAAVKETQFSSQKKIRSCTMDMLLDKRTSSLPQSLQ